MHILCEHCVLCVFTVSACACMGKDFHWSDSHGWNYSAMLCIRFHECTHIGCLCRATVLHVNSTHKIGLELCVNMLNVIWIS